MCRLAESRASALFHFWKAYSQSQNLAHRAKRVCGEGILRVAVYCRFQGGHKCAAAPQFAKCVYYAAPSPDGRPSVTCIFCVDARRCVCRPPVFFSAAWSACMGIISETPPLTFGASRRSDARLIQEHFWSAMSKFPEDRHVNTNRASIFYLFKKSTIRDRFTCVARRFNNLMNVRAILMTSHM